MYMMNNNVDDTQPYLTLDVMPNQSVSPSDVRTVFVLLAYVAPMLSRSWPCTLYISRVCHSLSLFTLSNAFSWSTKTMFSSLSHSVTFSLSCPKAKIASVQPLPFLKPICASLGMVLPCNQFVVFGLWHAFFTLGLVGRCLCISHSLLCCLSSSILVLWLLAASRLGLCFLLHAFWKIEISQVMPISPLVRMPSVVTSSILGLLFLGLVSLPIGLQI